jgi:hypothetical protein
MLLVAALASLVAAATAGARAGTSHGILTVRTVHVRGSPMYIEGAVTFVAVERRHGRTIVQQRIDKRLRLSLAAGRYRLRSWVRPCDGNCGYLDPPADRCSQPFSIRRGQRVVATIRIRDASPCRISFRRT